MAHNLSIEINHSDDIMSLAITFRCNFWLCVLDKWGLVWLKAASMAGASDCTPQCLWGVITCPCPWYFLLAHKSSNKTWHSIDNHRLLNITLKSINIPVKRAIDDWQEKGYQNQNEEIYGILKYVFFRKRISTKNYPGSIIGLDNGLVQI